jgi:O-antigen ligase
LAGLLLAIRSPAYPLALSGLPPIVLAILGDNPLPRGVLTAAVAVWIAVGVIFAVLRGEESLPLRVLLTPAVILSLLLLALMLLRLGDSLAPDVGRAKVQLFLAANVMMLIGGLVVGVAAKHHLRAFFRLAAAVATLGAFVLMIQLLRGSAQEIFASRFTLSPENDPISLGRASATGVLLAVYLVLSRENVLVRGLAAVSIPVLAVALFASGSRGPAVGMVVGLAVFVACGATSQRARRGLLVVTASVVLASVAIPQLVPDASISRTLAVVTSDGEIDTNGRTAWWELAYEAFADEPLTGLGTGGFAGLPAGAAYPHNLFLEAASELGLLGLLLTIAFVAIISAVLLRGWQRSRGDERLTFAAVAALFAAALTNAMFSGAIANNHALWLWAGLGTGLALRQRYGAVATGLAPRAPNLSRTADSPFA